MEENKLQTTEDTGLIKSLSDLQMDFPLAINKAGELVLMEYRRKCQNFISMLDRLPPADSIDRTPDGQALTVLISHIEMTLDEMFFGLWDTVDFKWGQIANEVVGSLLLVVVHPVTGREIKRTGAASIQIMVDAIPEELKYDPADSKQVTAKKKKDRNQWALDVQNKKSNALDMSFPKLKAECTKNAAQSLGRLFGRDLNRKKFDTFQPLLKSQPSSDNQQSTAVINSTKEAIEKAKARTI